MTSRLKHPIVLLQPQILAHKLLIPLFSMFIFIFQVSQFFFKDPQFERRIVRVSFENSFPVVKLSVLCLQPLDLLESGRRFGPSGLKLTSKIE